MPLSDDKLSQFSSEMANSLARLFRKTGVAEVKPARLGDGSGTVIVPPAKRIQGCQLYAYLEVDGTREVVQVANTSSTITFDNTAAGLPILIGKPYGSKVFHILGPNHNEMESFTGGALPSQVAEKINRGLDPRRWLQLKPIANDTLVVGLSAGPIRFGATMYYHAHDEDFIDLTSYVPATTGKAKWVIVEGALSGSTFSTNVVEGSEFVPAGTENKDALPTALTAGNVALFAAYLYQGQTAIKQKHLLPLKTFHTNDSDTYKVKVSSNDTTPEFLSLKVIAGSFISVDVADPSANESLEINWLGANFNDLLDTDLPSPNDGDVPAWNSGTGRWEATAGGGSDTKQVKVSSDDTTEGYLEDKIVAGSTKLTVATINGGGNEDVSIDFGTVEINDLSDATITSPTDDDLIVYDTSAFVNKGPGEISVWGWKDNLIAGGRISLSSTLAIPTSDITAATTVYYLPQINNRIALVDGSGNAQVYSFTSASLSLSGYTASTNYDIFAYQSSGTVTLESVAWTNATTRATALAFDNTIGYYKSGDTTRRYLGTIRTTSTTGQAEDSETKRFCWNYYNRAIRRAYKTYNNPHGYSTNTYRAFDADSTNKVEILRGVYEEAIQILLVSGLSATSGTSTVAVGEDSSSPATVLAALQNANSGTVLVASGEIHASTVGYHEYYVVERSNGSGSFNNFRLAITYGS